MIIFWNENLKFFVLLPISYVLFQRKIKKKIKKKDLCVHCMHYQYGRGFTKLLYVVIVVYEIR